MPIKKGKDINISVTLADFFFVPQRTDVERYKSKGGSDYLLRIQSRQNSKINIYLLTVVLSNLAIKRFKIYH